MLALTLTLTAAAWMALFALFIIALRRRLFARYTGGFFVSTLVALVGVALMSASVVGVWGYEAAKRMLDQELIVELENVGTIVEGEVGRDINYMQGELASVGTSMMPLGHVPTSEVLVRLRTLQAADPYFLQVAFLDRDGRVLATTSDAGPREEANRVAVAFSLEGKPFVSEPYLSDAYKRQVVYVGIPMREAAGTVVGIVAAWYDLQSDLSEIADTAKFNQSGYAVIVDGEGQIIAHHDRSRLNEDISSYPAVQRARQDQSGALTALNAKGESRLFGYRRMSNPSTLARQPWVLLTEINADEQMASLLRLRRELALSIGLVMLAVLIVAHQVSRSIQQPLQQLGAFTHRIGAGDLTERLSLSGRDVAGRLAAALNEMAAGLQERDHVKEVFGRYIATQASDQILSGKMNLGGESRYVTVLFSDIRNFTGMAEQMTPAQVVSFLNDYFSEMVDAVFEHDGMLDKFLGDGLMAVFGVFGETSDHPRQAVRAALRMKALLAKINGERSMTGKPPIAIGIGIHSAEAIVGNIGSRKRLEFTVVGDGVNVSSRVQALNKEFGTTILISEVTYEALQGEFECHPMPATALRGRTGDLKLYEVVSARDAAGV
jgi:class 3 adenylate cyclase